MDNNENTAARRIFDDACRAIESATADQSDEPVRAWESLQYAGRRLQLVQQLAGNSSPLFAEAVHLETQVIIALDILRSRLAFAWASLVTLPKGVA